MKDYTYQEMMKMQEDAVKRVQEMKRRSVFAVEDANRAFEQENTHKNKDITGVFTQPVSGVKRISMPIEFDSDSHSGNAHKNRQESNTPAFDGLLDILSRDGDTPLMLSLLLLLMTDGGDKELISALAYILL